ncbi:MAG: hypothetical protein GY694_06385 [Gammaproteobacteria bacterium]|nr:hypothetical protein [Gammaproteobacteria bacterium]
MNRDSAKAMILHKAIQSAANNLGITDLEIQSVLGTKMVNQLELNSEPGQRAILIVRIHEKLSKILGSDAPNIRHWFVTNNLHLGGAPKELVLAKADALCKIESYLDRLMSK